MFNSSIVRLASGSINKVNDSVIGGGGAGTGAGGSSKLSGQLGQGWWMDEAQVIYDSAIGVVNGGHFRYVRLAAAASVVVRGQIVFNDISVADNLFQVTTAETGSVPGAQLRAGIVLNPGWTPGNYGVIQDVGDVFVKFRAALSNAPAGVGVSVFAAGVGAGVDNGFADTLDSGAPLLFSDFSILMNRYLGAAVQLPVNGGLTLVRVNMMNSGW